MQQQAVGITVHLRRIASTLDSPDVRFQQQTAEPVHNGSVRCDWLQCAGTFFSIGYLHKLPLEKYTIDPQKQHGPCDMPDCYFFE